VLVFRNYIIYFKTKNLKPFVELISIYCVDCCHWCVVILYAV